MIDSVTRVRAQILARDSEADLAILRIAPINLADRRRIPFQNTTGRAPIVPGERLIALGYPLNQSLTVTSGIASSVRAGAVISDVNINPGNSGGPLLNVDGSRLGLAGVLVGVIGAFALTRVLDSLLYDVSPTDTRTFVGAALIVMVVALVAALGPARRASRVDPTVTLRSA